MQIVKYKPASLGLGTESSSKLQPLDFSPNIINRFYNMLGDLEKRRGLQQLGGSVSSREIYGLHEYISTSGDAFIIAQVTAKTALSQQYGTFYVYNETSAYWIDRSIGIPGTFSDYIPPPNAQKSVQMNDKIIYYDGINRPFYQVWKKSTGAPISGEIVEQGQLHAIVTKGIEGSGTNNTTLFDADISNWRTQTNVAVNDLVEISDTGGIILNANLAYGIVTSVGTSSLDITTVGSAATGIGQNSQFTNRSGNPYRIFDLVELNIIPKGGIVTGPLIYDNVATGGSATSANAISVTGLNMSTTQIRRGDYIYNTTRAAVTIVTTVTSNISVTPITSQTAGDSLVFLKEAMPIPSFAHVHYGRLHLIDARDPTKIRVSGPNDPEDFTTFNKTLSSVTIDYGSRQPKGDTLLTMATFQRYLVVGGQAGLFVTDGTNPIQDVTADVIDLDPAGLFPQGVFSPQALQSIGNEMLYIGNDGMRSFLAAFDSKNTTTNNRSEQIKTEVINALQAQTNNLSKVQLIHYPRRNWVMMKIGDVIYNYNYTPMYSNGQYNNIGTFTKFTGLLAEQDKFLIRRNGDFITAGSAAGVVCQFDVSGVFTDNGTNISTTYVSPWHTLQEGNTNIDINIKDGRYIKPVFETSAEIKYNISVVGDFSELANDSVVVTAAVSGITNPKMPLRWRGQQAQFTITTDTSVGADIINSYTVYGNVFGRK